MALTLLTVGIGCLAFIALGGTESGSRWNVLRVRRHRTSPHPPGQLLVLPEQPSSPARTRPEPEAVAFLDLVAAESDVAGLLAAIPPEDECSSPWFDLFTQLRKVERPLPYVGGFQKVTRTAAAHAWRLPPSERPVAALVVLDRTARDATSWREFCDGVHAAAELDRRITQPETVLERLLERALAHRHGPPREDPVAYALRFALETYLQTPQSHFTSEQVGYLAAVVETLRPASRQPLLHLAVRFDKRERKILEDVLAVDTAPSAAPL